ncbi:MAG TPA: hypothetical protein VK178_06405 [Opitutaceae bacterium]|nr:hypothetical protein [Opitutaceae bacterium]
MTRFALLFALSFGLFGCKSAYVGPRPDGGTPFASPERPAKPETALLTGPLPSSLVSTPEVSLKQEELKTYGGRITGNIEVAISGSGVRKPGRYFLYKNEPLLRILMLAEIAEPKCTVWRSYSTAEQIAEARFTFDISTDEGMRKAKEFLLEEGDAVIVGQPQD